MPRGDKSSYTDKQKRQAEHIEEGYENARFGRRSGAARVGTVHKATAAAEGGSGAASKVDKSTMKKAPKKAASQQKGARKLASAAKADRRRVKK